MLGLRPRGCRWPSGWSLGITGFLPKRYLVHESPLPAPLYHGGVPRISQDGEQQAEAQQAGSGSSLAAGGCTTPAVSSGRFFGCCPFHTSPFGCAGMDKKGGMLHGETKAEATDSEVPTQERGRAQGRPMPFPRSPN